MGLKRAGSVLYLVIPCFNELEVLPQTAAEVKKAMGSMMETGLISGDSRVIFVDDGSGDGSWEWLRARAGEDSLFGALRLGRNAGHQNALYAGYMAVKNRCDMAVSLDADLQDDLSLVPAMAEQFYAGADIVYAIRRSRRGESKFKRATAALFYRLVNGLGAGLPPDCGDFRLLSRRALNQLSLYREEQPFLRGLVPMLGLPSAYLYFDRGPRRSGRSKYSVGKMLRLALDGICSLTTRPLSLLLGLGLCLFVAAGLWLLIHLFRPVTEQTVVATIWAACGLLLTGMGILGQYMGRIWRAQLDRPPYFIAEACGMEKEE